MPHVDPEVIALLALGEPVASDVDLGHLRDCRLCAGEIAQLGVAARVGRSAMDAGPLLEPNPAVWHAIHAGLGLADDVSPSPMRPVDTIGPVAVAPLATVSEPVDALSTHRAHTGGRQNQRRRHGRNILTGLLATAALAAVVVGGFSIWSATRVPSAEVLATAELAAFPGWDDASGSATAEKLADGSRELTIRLSVPTSSTDYREVWLISSDGSRLVSLGVLDHSTGVFPIPRGISITQYDLVDVSAEPLDGDPAHSGDSIVRGALA
ncbi:MAG: hypothetical protein JWQ43_3155 [Glaciihabitans sp.]|nr:hypothetical protein [Glaciihabitans sp.]